MKLSHYITWNNIGVWILVFFFIRLIGITNAPLESGHSWRQCTGLMVSRNFVEDQSSIFYPTVNETNGGLGYVGMEFPALYYAHALVADVVGYDHWYGRLINLIISSLGIWFFYRLVKKYADEKLAFQASLILLSSIWFAFSRKTMSDTFCVSLVMMALWYGLQYLEQGKAKNLIGYGLLALLGVLSKIPAGIYLALFIAPAWKCWDKKGRLFSFSLVTVLCIGIVYYWYFIWCVHLSGLSGKWYNIGSSFAEGVHEIHNHWGNVAKRFYFSAFNGFVFFILFVAGLVRLWRERNIRLIYVFGIITFMFAVYAVKSGRFFQHHDYYIIPYVPVMALIAAFGLRFLDNKKIIFTLLAVGMLEGIINQQHDFFIKNNQRYKLTLEDMVNQLAEPTDLIAINGGGDPQLIYFAHRKGWSFDEEEANTDKFWLAYQEKGAKWIIFDRHLFQTPLDFPVAFENEDFLVYQLQGH
ncbi:MAG: ArnT family glycosyltransferase [Flavobacteriales bacterium]